MKKGLVLEGGGMKCMFTVGVLDVMMEHGVEVDCIVGVSAGAAFGCNYKSRQAGRAVRYSERFVPDPRYMGVRSYLTTGNYINAEFCYHTVPTVYDVFDNEAYVKNPMEFHVVCTDIERGLPVYHRIDSMDREGLDWIRATGSLPILARPVKLGGMKLLDGGLTDSIPLRYAQELGVERNVVVLTQPLSQLMPPTNLMPLFHIFMRRYPEVISLMRERYQMYNTQLRYVQEQEWQEDALVICPDEKIPISRISERPKELRMVYEMGRQKAEAMLPQIQHFLKKTR